MEQEFLLKHYGNFSLAEQNNMTGESRKWHMERLEREYRERNEKQQRASK